MRAYILEIARDLFRDNPDITIDEIAAIAGTTTPHVHDYFDTVNELRAALVGESVRAPQPAWSNRGCPC